MIRPRYAFRTAETLSPQRPIYHDLQAGSRRRTRAERWAKRFALAGFAFLIVAAGREDAAGAAVV